MMFQNILTSLCTQKGFEITDSHSYGTVGDYMVTVSSEEGLCLGLSAFISNDCTVIALKERLKKENLFEKYNIKESAVGNSFLFAEFYETAIYNNISSFIDFAVSLLHDYGAKGTEICPICGEAIKETDCVIKYTDKIVTPMHLECSERIIAKPSGKIFLPVVGAFAGAMFALLPWLICHVCGLPAGIFGVLCPLLAVLAYDLLGGRKTGLRVVSVTTVSVISVILCEFISLYFDVSKNIGSNVLCAMLDAILKNTNIQNGTMLTLTAGLVLAIIGSFGFTKLIHLKNINS